MYIRYSTKEIMSAINKKDVGNSKGIAWMFVNVLVNVIATVFTIIIII